MKIIKRLKSFLDKQELIYEIVNHPRVYTSQELAALEHLPGKEVAKVVMVKVNGSDVMVVIPASENVDFIKLSMHFQTNNIRLADEGEFRHLFPDCEVGAMPPFGNLYDLLSLMDESLIEEKEIVFNGGTHSAIVKMDTQDFLRAASPEIGDFCMMHGARI